MESLPNNSGKSFKPEVTNPEKREPVAQGVRRKTVKGLIKESIHTEDLSIEMILQDYIIPTLKDGIFDTAIGILDYMRGGSGYSRFSSRNRRFDRDRRGRNEPVDYTRRSRISERYSYNEAPEEPAGAERIEYYDVMIPDYDPKVGRKDSVRAKNKAMSIMAELEDDIRAYGVARLDHFYELCGLSSASYSTDYNYGWTNLTNAKVYRVPDGWAFDMPKVMPIE